jgi:hypothetical protein
MFYSQNNFSYRIFLITMFSGQTEISPQGGTESHLSANMPPVGPPNWIQLGEYGQSFPGPYNPVSVHQLTPNGNGGPTLPPQPFSWQIPDALHDTLMVNANQRRRSSAVSPRTIQPLPNTQNYNSATSQAILPPVTPIGSSQNQANQLRNPSISSMSSSTTTTTATDYTEVPPQHPFFSLLSEICTEALRRRWHSEMQRQQMNSFSFRYPAHHRSQDWRNSRYEPYELPPSLRPSAFAQPPDLMSYIHLIADALWSNARTGPRLGPEGRPEMIALEEMRTLYSLGTSVARAHDAAERGETFNLEEMMDVVGGASALCRVLGYEEGRGRCEELGRQWAYRESGVL